MKRQTALDGLRGLAIVMVVVYHAWPNLLPGGAYGVTLFFVLSGFLITRLLLRDLDSPGGVDLRRFYWNRGVRLLPALMALLVGYALIYRSFTPILWPLTYSTNFAQIAGANVEHLAHTWSLAVEEHFYIVWPLILISLPKAVRFRATAALLGAAVAYRAILMVAGADFERVYFGTDANAFALLAGCTLGFAYHEGRLIIPSRTTTMIAIGSIGLAAATIPALTTAHLWGHYAVVALSLLAIAGALQRVPMLELSVLRWLGMISYGLYLWHTPILSTRWPIHRNLLVAISLGIAWFSWQYLEQPLRRRLRCDERSRVRDVLSEAWGVGRISRYGHLRTRQL